MVRMMYVVENHEYVVVDKHIEVKNIKKIKLLIFLLVFLHLL